MDLADMQWSYRGLTFGEGCDVLVNSVDGFEGFNTRNSDSDQPRGDGAIRGLDYVAARTIAFELSVWEPDMDGTLYESLWATVREAFRPSLDTDDPLVFARPGQPQRMIRCRPIQLTPRAEKWDRFNRAGEPKPVLKAVDPRIYSVEERSEVVPGFNTSRTGVSFPIVEFPIDWAATTQTEVAIENDGTATAYPLLRFYGPTAGTTTSVTLQNTTTGQVWTVVTPIAPNQILTGDMDAAVTGADRLVVALDGSTRYGAWSLPREPFGLAPGTNNLRFTYTGAQPRCLVTWRSTWMS